MNKSIFLLFSVLFFLSLVRTDVGDGPCTRTETVIIRNVGNQQYLALSLQRIVLSGELKQIWCLNVETGPHKKNVFRHPAQGQTNTVALYCGNSNFVMASLEGAFDGAHIQIANTADSLGNSGLWTIKYLPNKYYSIQSMNVDSTDPNVYALAAGSNFGEVDLAVFDQTNSLQQWEFIAKDY